MSGDSHTNDDDFLDEDFVVEDLTGKNDDLADLFDESEPARELPAGGESEANTEPDEDDLLFADHTEGLDDEVAFPKETFSEDNENDWDGEQLDLESVGVNAEPDPVIDAAKEEVADALGELLEDGPEFALEGDGELDLVDVDDDGIAEFEQSGAFVLDDSDGEWAEDLLDIDDDDGDAVDPEEQSDEIAPLAGEVQEPDLAQASEASAEEPCEVEGALVDTSEADGNAPSLDHVELLDAATPEDVLFEEAEEWQPLPETSMDELSEVDEVQRSEFGDEPDEADEGPALEDVDGHDLYADDELEPEAEVIGAPAAGSGRWASVVLSLAASLLILVGAAAVFARPQWFGLKVDLEPVARLEVKRPRIAVDVAEPPAVSPTAQPENVLAGGGPAAGDQPNARPQVVEPQQPTAGRPEAPPVANEPDAVTPSSQPAETGGVAVAPGADPAENVGEPVAEPAGEVPVEVPVEAPVAQLPAGEPVAQQPTEQAAEQAAEQPTEQPVAVAPPEEPSWPVARADGQQAAPSTSDAPSLTRMGNQLLVGELAADRRRSDTGRDGVVPGNRAFAQLRNGNYFIGRVKHVAEASITLRVETGEVTLAMADIASLTRLGSSDYEQLQKATKGFVRLTNNNRLVGGILSRIADDHIVLEFRKNRVMLPKSVVGEIVQGQDGTEVRLDTTAEEDNWLRELAERELGSGRGVPPNKPDGKTPVPGGPPK